MDKLGENDGKPALRLQSLDGWPVMYQQNAPTVPLQSPTPSQGQMGVTSPVVGLQGGNPQGGLTNIQHTINTQAVMQGGITNSNIYSNTTAEKKLLAALNKPSSQQQQDQILDVLKSNPDLITVYVKQRDALKSHQDLQQQDLEIQHLQQIKQQQQQIKHQQQQIHQQQQQIQQHQQKIQQQQQKIKQLQDELKPLQLQQQLKELQQQLQK